MTVEVTTEPAVFEDVQKTYGDGLLAVHALPGCGPQPPGRRVRSRPLLRACINDLWRFALALAPSTPFLVAAEICLTALLSRWPGLRAINRLDVATVVCVRST